MLHSNMCSKGGGLGRKTRSWLCPALPGEAFPPQVQGDVSGSRSLESLDLSRDVASVFVERGSWTTPASQRQSNGKKDPGPAEC